MPAQTTAGSDGPAWSELSLSELASSLGKEEVTTLINNCWHAAWKIKDEDMRVAGSDAQQRLYVQAPDSLWEDMEGTLTAGGYDISSFKARFQSARYQSTQGESSTPARTEMDARVGPEAAEQRET